MNAGSTSGEPRENGVTADEQTSEHIAGVLRFPLPFVTIGTDKSHSYGMGVALRSSRVSGRTRLAADWTDLIKRREVAALRGDRRRRSCGQRRVAPQIFAGALAGRASALPDGHGSIELVQQCDDLFAASPGREDQLVTSFDWQYRTFALRSFSPNSNAKCRTVIVARASGRSDQRGASRALSFTTALQQRSPVARLARLKTGLQPARTPAPCPWPPPSPVCESRKQPRRLLWKSCEARSHSAT